MRRWMAAVALGGVAVLALASCAKPAGVDGDLINDWPVIGEPAVFVPDAGTCHPQLREVGYLSSYQPVECGTPHLAEIAHVGDFTGEVAARINPPPAGSPDFRLAWRNCDERVSQWLGGDWRTARLKFTVVLPSSAAWSGGARWFRCDVSEVQSAADDWQVPANGSLKGALDGASPLAHTCFKPQDVTRDHVGELAPTPCDQPHQSEFAGVYTAADVPYQAALKDEAGVDRGCTAVIAAFLKVADRRLVAESVGWIYFHPSRESWAAGDRGVQCFVWLDWDVSRSLRGAGVKALAPAR